VTKALQGTELGTKIGEKLPSAVVEADEGAVVVSGDSVLEVARFLRDTPGLDFDYLVAITAVDYLDYFEVIYNLCSLEHNHSTVLKARLYDREDPLLPSLTPIWRGADLQEREVYDLMGIKFSGHPNLKRVLLWQGFQGYPLRKDFFY